MADASFNKHISDRNWTTRQRTHTQFQNTEEFLQAVGGAGRGVTKGKAPAKGRGGKPSAQGGRGGRGGKKGDSSEEDEEYENEEFDVEAHLKPGEQQYLGHVNEQRRKTIFSYTARCLHCPIKYEAKHVSAFLAEDFARLAAALQLEKVDLRAEKRTAKRCGKLLLAELDQRLNNIDDHPFYTQKSFKTREDYDNWKEYEKDRIKTTIQKMKPVPGYSGTLIIRVMRAKNLVVKDDEPQPINAYCFLTLKGEEKQTTVINKEANPDWGEEFTYNLSSGDEVLKVEVWQKIIIGSTFLGGIDIPVNEIPEHQKQMKWYQLQQKGGGKNVSGTLRLSLHLVGREGPSAEHIKPGELDSYSASTNHNENYQILLHYLYANDTTTISSTPAVSSDGDVAVEKWSDAQRQIDTKKQAAKTVSNEDGDRKQRFEEMKREKLSDAAKWLLGEYQERYGIGPFYAQLSMVDMLVRPFTLTTSRLDYLYEVLFELKILESAEPLPMNTPEKQLSTELNEELKNKLIVLVKHYNLVFKPEIISKGALATVVVLISHLGDIDSGRICEVLAEYVECAVRDSYESFKNMAADEPEEKKLSVASGFIPAAVSSDMTTVGDEFPPDLHLPELLASSYYKCLARDVTALYADESATLTVNTFDLYNHLNSLHELSGSAFDKKKMLNLGAIFARFVTPWIGNFIEQFKSWNRESIAQDNWQPLMAGKSGETALMHSESVADLFTAFSEFEKFFKKLHGIRTPEHTKAFANALSVIVKDYVNRLRVLNFEDLNADEDRLADTHDFTPYLKLSKEMKRKCEKTEALAIKQPLCIRINNIDNITEQLEAFAEAFDKTSGEKDVSLAELLAETLDWLDDSKQEILDAVATKMDTTIQLALEVSQQTQKKRKKKEKHSDSEDSDPEVFDAEGATEAELRIEPLIAYLRTQLITLSDNLYYPVFIALLEGVWAIALKDIELVIVPPAADILDKSAHCDDDYIDLVPEFVGLIADFFHANGAGLPKDLLDNGESSIGKILKLFHEETPDLIKLYTKLEANTDPKKEKTGMYDSTPILEEAILSVLARRKGDKEAIKFAKQHKASAPNLYLYRHFNLPKTEVLIEKYRCCNSKLSTGWFYVTTTHVCFDSFTGGNRVDFKIEDIREISKKKIAGIHDNGLKLIMKSGQSNVFSGFANRNSCYKAVLKQASKIDCILGQQVRDGVLKADDHDEDGEKGSSRSSSSSRIGTSVGERTDDKKKRSSAMLIKVKKHVRSSSKAHAEPSDSEYSDSDTDSGSRGPVLAIDPGLLPARQPKQAASEEKTPKAEPKKKKHKRGISLGLGGSGSSTPKASPKIAAIAEEPVTAKSPKKSSGDASAEPAKPSGKFTVSHAGGAAAAAAAAPGSPAGSKRKPGHRKTPSIDAKSKKEKKKSKAEGEDKKQEKQANRTKKLQKRFGLGEARFIDKFACAAVDGGGKGTLYIANSHVCFFSNHILANTKIAIPFSLIKEVRKTGGKHQQLELVTESQNFEFKNFGDAFDAVFELVSKGWRTRTGGNK